MIRNSEEFLAWENVPKDGMWSLSKNSSIYKSNHNIMGLMIIMCPYFVVTSSINLVFRQALCPEWRYDGMGQEQILVVERPFLTAFLFSLDPDRFLYIFYNTFRFCL